MMRLRWFLPARAYLAIPLAFATGCVQADKRTAAGKENSAQTKVSPIEEEVKLSPSKKQKPTAKMLVDIGDVHFQGGRLHLAEDHFKRAIEADKKFAPAYVGLSKVHAKRGENDAAFETLDRGLSFHPKSPELWNEIAVLRAGSRDYKGAIDAAEKALKQDPGNVLYMSNLAGMLAMDGQMDRGFELYSKAYGPAEARYRIAGLLFHQGKRDDSIRQLHMALQNDPQHDKAMAMIDQLNGRGVKPVGYLAPQGEEPVQSPLGR